MSEPKIYEKLTTECCGKYITFQGVTHNQCKQKLRECESIGTIDEFKALKEKAEPKKPIDISMVRDCAGCTAWNADCANIRANAIDEFVIKLKRVRGYGLITNFDRPFGITFNKLDEIAEQLKGGAE